MMMISSLSLHWVQPMIHGKGTTRPGERGPKVTCPCNARSIFQDLNLQEPHKISSYQLGVLTLSSHCEQWPCWWPSGVLTPASPRIDHQCVADCQVVTLNYT